MVFVNPPAYPDDDHSNIPGPAITDSTIKMAKTVKSKNPTFMEAALEAIPGITPEEFQAMFSAIMNIYVTHQHAFKFIAVGIPSPDLVCEISMHNVVPTLEGTVYRSYLCGIHGHYNNIPGMRATFPGMVATPKGGVFGDPFASNTEDEIRTMSKMRKPRRKC